MENLENTSGTTRQRQRLQAWTQLAGLARRPVVRVRKPRVTPVVARVRTLDQALAQILRPIALPALRVLLGLVFVWFGALKISGRSPVAALVGQTLPFANAHLVLLVLGTLEVSLGVVLICGVWVRLALPLLALHLAGTFTTFFMAPHLMFNAGDPLLLTANGEFVAKNVVLIAATLVLIAHTGSKAGKALQGSGTVPRFVASRG